MADWLSDAEKMQLAKDVTERVRAGGNVEDVIHHWYDGYGPRDQQVREGARYIAKVVAEQVEKEKEILIAQPDLQSKPENVRQKMVEGRIGKYFEQICLLEQPFVKDPSVSVGDLLKKSNASVVRFTRYGLGEGMEKKVDNFAEEVASYMKG